MAAPTSVRVWADQVVTLTGDVEVQPPINVVVVLVADARVVHGAEAEARADRSIGVQVPPADVAVPARLELALPAHGTAVAPGFRLCPQPATIVLETGSDVGNFSGVAIYVDRDQAQLHTGASGAG